MKLVTADQMREIEHQVAAAGTTIAALADRAGRALAEAVLEHWPDREWLVLAGPGNNGGDGLLAADVLASGGLPGRVYTVGRHDPAGEARRTEDDPELETLRSLLERKPVVIDCLLGTGWSRPPEGRLAEIIQRANVADIPVLAADIPSGVKPNTGAVPSVAVRADRTIAFGFAKVGDVVYPGAEYAGQLTVSSLGIPRELADHVTLEVTEPSEVTSLLPPRKPDSNKGTYGRVLVVGGSHDFPSAPGLSCIAALRTGAGLAHAGVLDLSQRVIAAHALEPVYSVLQEDDGHISQEAAGTIGSLLPKASALVFGPGMGITGATAALTREVLQMVRESEGTPAVIDADGLNALSRWAEWWKDMPVLVLTPHPGEMSRLTGRPIEEIQSDRVGVAREYAALWGSVVVLKGAGTVVARPDGHARVNPTGGANLATGGTGDVLSGIIGGLLAQGLDPWDAAVAGVYLHGLAGDLLARKLGDAGTLAEDLLPAIPRARLALHKGVTGK